MSVNSVVSTNKVLDIVDNGNIVSVSVRNLTLKEKDSIYLRIEEKIKNRKRKEFLAIAGMMEPKDRTKFLVEAANSNKVTSDEVVTESQTVEEVANILTVVCTPSLKWVDIMATDAIDQVLKAYYWALNIDIPDVELPEVTAPPAGEGGDPAFFPKSQPNLS